jgi:hypothetical protein
MKTNMVRFEPTVVYKLIPLVNSIRFAGDVHKQWFATAGGTGQKKYGTLSIQNATDLRIEMVGDSFHELGSFEL